MGNLRYRSSSVSRSYELKDSSAKPRLAIRTSAGIKYLTLKTGLKTGEMGIRGASKNYHVKTWDTDIPEFWRGMDPAEPFKGIKASRGDTTHGGMGVWVLVNEENYPVVALGRIGADRPDEWAKAIWIPNVQGTASMTKWPTNMSLTAEQVTHPKRLKGNIRLATAVSPNDGHAVKNNVVISDIVTNLTSSGAYAYDSGGYRFYGYGYAQITKKGIYWPTGTEEFGVAPYSGSSGGTGIDSEGYKVNAPGAYRTKVINSYRHYTTYYWTLYTGIATTGDGGGNQVGAPYIQMYGASDDDSYPDWYQRDFYIEYPYAWGEDTNPNDYFTFTPKQVITALKTIAEAKGIATYNYGFTRGRNY